jgi:hypothetical protein
MIKRRYVATIVMSVGVLGKLNAAGAHAALPANAVSELLSTMGGAPSAEQEFHGPIGRLNVTPATPQPALNMADGDDKGDDGDDGDDNGDNDDNGHHHRSHDGQHGDDGDHGDDA